MAATASVPSAASAPTTEATAPERSAAPLAVPPAASKNAILRGRCVDANDAPLAGCVVSLHGWGANQDRIDKWLLDHSAKPEWTDPPKVTTTADGTFAFEFWPPPPWQFLLDVRAEGCGAMDGRWSKLDEGSTTELGDVRMTPGVRVTGRVVDTEGRPQAKQYVSFERSGGPAATQAPVKPNSYDQVHTREDGTFATRGWLPPGTYVLRCDRTIDKPATIELRAERRLEDVTIVLAPRVEVLTITGRVVDEAGQPVGNAEIEERLQHRGTTASTGSQRDGTFTLSRPESSSEATARIVVAADGFECEPDPRPVAWGTKDVEFRVVRGGTLTLRVTDAHDAPVTSYSVRMVPRNRMRWSSTDTKVRAQGTHENGTTVIAGVTRGDWLVVVEFPTATALDALFHPLRTTTNAPMRLDLRVGAESRRWLRVVTNDDTPVAGTQVQLCELFGGTLDSSRIVMRREQWMMNSGGNGALVLSEGKTDAEGRIELHGPGDRELGLNLLGPGHIPLVQGGVRLDVTDEFVVRVNLGARLTGQIVPPEALAELRRLVRIGPTDAFPAKRRPQLRLVSPTRKRFPDARGGRSDLANLQVADDGSIDANGLPPGPWQIEISAWELGESGGGTRGFAASHVVLVEGQTTRTDIDLQSIVPGTVDGVVVKNGAPLAEAIVTLRSENEWINLTTDAQGHFTQSCRPGEYSLLVQRPSEAGNLPMLRSASRVRVVRGETTRHTFAVASGTLRLTVLDPDGQPVPRLQVFSKPDGDHLPATDANGKVTVEVTAQNATLHVLPKRLSSPEAQQNLWKEAGASGNQDPLGPHWITVGTVAIQQGQTHELELRLPKEWSQ